MRKTRGFREVCVHERVQAHCVIGHGKSRHARALFPRLTKASGQISLPGLVVYLAPLDANSEDCTPLSTAL